MSRDKIENRKKNGATWHEWRIALVMAGLSYSYNVEQTGMECWVTFFDDDYTPEEALEEDLSNA